MNVVRAREIMIPTIGGLVGGAAIAGFLYLTRGAWLPSLLRHPQPAVAGTETLESSVEEALRGLQYRVLDDAQECATINHNQEPFVFMMSYGQERDGAVAYAHALHQAAAANPDVHLILAQGMLNQTLLARYGVGMTWSLYVRGKEFEIGRSDRLEGPPDAAADYFDALFTRARTHYQETRVGPSSTGDTVEKILEGVPYTKLDDVQKLPPLLEQKPSAIYLVYTEHGHARNIARAMKPALQEYPQVKFILVHEKDTLGEAFIRFGIVVEGMFIALMSQDASNYQIAREGIPEEIELFRDMFKSIEE